MQTLLFERIQTLVLERFYTLGRCFVSLPLLMRAKGLPRLFSRNKKVEWVGVSVLNRKACALCLAMPCTCLKDNMANIERTRVSRRDSRAAVLEHMNFVIRMEQRSPNYRLFPKSLSHCLTPQLTRNALIIV